MPTQFQDFLNYLLAKKGSSLISHDHNGAVVDIEHYSDSNDKYLSSTTRFEVREDGRVMTLVRDEVEGTDFRQRNRYLLDNVTLLDDSKHRIHQLGWD
ncbi:hypothetical protein D3C87_616530 [compost metagenome]